MRATLLLCTALAGCASFPNDVSGKQASVLSELRLSLRETGEGLEAGTPTQQQQPREWLGATATATKTSGKTSGEADDAILWLALSDDPSSDSSDVDISSVPVTDSIAPSAKV